MKNVDSAGDEKEITGGNDQEDAVMKNVDSAGDEKEITGGNDQEDAVMKNVDSAGDEKEITGGNDIVQDAPDPRGGTMPENMSRESLVLGHGGVVEEAHTYYFRH